MVLSEIFYSIQGEGLNAGVPAIFVRFGNCNLKCTWCDTKYTWHPDFRDNREVAMAEVFARIRKAAPKCKHLVITGGEPLLQQKAICEIRRKFKDYYIEVETNGSIAPTVECAAAVDLFTVSYKTKNSGNAPYELMVLPEISEIASDITGARTSHSALRADYDEAPRRTSGFRNCVVYKFVVCEKGDFREIEAIIKKYALPANKIFLMPEGVTRVAILAKTPLIVDYCKKRGYRFSTRLQTLIWGTKRGR